LVKLNNVTPPLTYIDLFAGCGGLSTGLHLAGLKGLFAVERNASAFSTLKANLIDNRKHFDWPAWLTTTNWDIKDLLARKARSLAKMNGAVDLVVGGPPCQGFSTNGRRREGDERNTLVHSYLKLVEQIQPRAIFFENVRGFTMKFTANAEEGQNYSDIVLRRLHELGYGDARGELIDMSNYGVPQRRKRFIVIATREGVADEVFAALPAILPAFLSEKRLPRKNRVRSALSDLQRCHGEAICPDSSGFQSGLASRPTTGLQRLLRTRLAPHVPDSHRFVQHSEKVKLVFNKLLAEAPRNHAILGKEGRAFGLKKRSVTILAANQTAPTVTTLPDDIIHYSEPRVMTVRECARLQTFPDWFVFKGQYTTGGKTRVTDTPRYTQVGNAVPPLFAELVGIAMKEVLQHVESPI
jgi:DNA (cytosine-5)-methyltransferase 1